MTKEINLFYCLAFRRQFLLDVGYELVDPYIKMRLNSERLPIRILNATKLIGYQPQQHNASSSSLSSNRKRDVVYARGKMISKQRGNATLVMSFG